LAERRRSRTDRRGSLRIWIWFTIALRRTWTAWWPRWPRAYKPYPRGAPPGLPFLWDRPTLERGLNFTLVTALGDVNLLGEIPGGGNYRDLLPDSVELLLFQVRCRCLSLRQLIRAKRAAGRPKDLETLAELEAIADESSDGPYPLTNS
jgi:hypothetical protein